MTKQLFIIGVFFVSFISQSCSSAASQNSPSQIKGETSQLQDAELPKQKKADFEGVSFTYNPQIFGEVRSERVAAHPLENSTDKPDSVAPAYRLFTFDLSTPYSNMEIAVYPIDDFPKMYAVNKSSVEASKKQNEYLRKVLKDKNFRVENQIPFLPFRDAHQTFQVKVRHFDFQNGKGILFLTFWSTEIEFPSNRQLRYIFEGITADGKYYVLGEMPISVAFLPEDSSDEFEGYKIYDSGNFDYGTVSKRINEANKKVAIRLENLPQNEFKPDPKYFEEIISSLKIEN